jgi:hypothetical protein
MVGSMYGSQCLRLGVPDTNRPYYNFVVNFNCWQPYLCHTGEADFKKHLPSHLRRPPRGPAGPAERDANLTPLGAPPIPGLAGIAPGSEAQGANLVPLGVRHVSAQNGIVLFCWPTTITLYFTRIAKTRM